MTYSQAITPNPHIPCKPGWCLQYVRQTFGLPAIHPTATAAWYAGTQHRNRDFPPGVWVPVWYALVNEPAGHVVLRAPDGSVYSTSDLGNKPHHHPDLADLEAYYRRYGMTLTYRGWTEDVQGIPVITRGGLAAQGTIIEPSEEDEMADAVDRIYEFTTTLFKQYHEASIAKIYDFTTTLFKQYHEASINETRAALRDAFKAYAAAQPGDLDAGQLALEVAKKFDAILAAGIKTVDVPATIPVEALDIPHLEGK